MSQPNFDHLDIKDDFEFNDGVGDVLKEKETYSFSWKKTFLVLSGITFSILILTFIILEIGKKALNLNQTSLEVAVESNEMIDRMVSEEAESSWEMIPDLQDEPDEYELIESIPPIKVTKPVTKQKKIKKPLEKTIKSTPVTTKIKTKDVTAKVQTYRVIAGSFSKYSNAKSKLNSLQKKGIDAFIWQSKSQNGSTFYKLQVGSFKSYQAAKKHVSDLDKKNIDSYILN